MSQKNTGEQGCWLKPNKNDFAWSVFSLKMKYWSLNVSHSCLFLKHATGGGGWGVRYHEKATICLNVHIKLEIR